MEPVRPAIIDAKHVLNFEKVNQIKNDINDYEVFAESARKKD